MQREELGRQRKQHVQRSCGRREYLTHHNMEEAGVAWAQKERAGQTGKVAGTKLHGPAGYHGGTGLHP